MAENMEGKNLDEKVKSSLRKMIRSCDNYIKEAKNLEQLEDNLKHMEETDESFHKHELVQILSDQLESKLGDLIDRSVNDSFNSSKFEGDIDSQNRMAEKICHDIIKHKEFLEFKSTFQTSTNKAVDNLMKNFHANFIEMNINSDEVVTLNEQNEVKSISFSNDLEYSSPDNSMNQNSFVFVTSEQFPTIAQNLDLRKPEEIRMRAMHQLLAIPASDPQAADHWIQIRRYLIATLRDPCASIANLCLKLHSRTLASSHYKVSVEIYINLVEHLSEYFRDRELEKRALKPSGVVDFASPENSFILKIFRLTNDYAKDITTKWTRYPDSFVETIINETLKLLNLASDYKFGSFMTSLHFLSVIDIKAIWFTKWMHGNDSRKTLINSIKKQELFLQTAVNSVLQYASVSSAKKSDPIGSGRKKSLTSLSLTGGSNNSSSKRMQFKKAELDYTHFVHSLNVLKRILSFKNGRQLFPVKISNREITIKDLIKIFIQIIFDTSGLISSSEFSPSKCTYELLQDLCVTEETCEACLCNEEVIEQLLKPIKSLQMTSKKNQFASSSSGNFSSMNSSTPHLNHNQQLDQEPSSMLLVANILSKLASTQCGYKQLIFNDSRQNFLASSIKNSPARTIASFVEDALNNHISLPIFELAEYLYLARLLYSKCQGAFLIAEYSLNMCIADAWINCDSSSKKIPPAPSPAVRNHSSLSGPNTPRQQQPNQVMKDPYQLTWPEALLDNLVSMASTTKGVVYLNQTNLINPVANYLSTRYRSRMQVGKYEKFGYGFIISQLSNAPTGTFYLNECAFVQYLIEEIWTELAYGSDDFMSAFPRSYSVEPIDKEVYKPMLCLMNIASSFPSAYELLVNLTATPRAQYGVRDVPKGLVSLLDRVVFLDKKLKISSLCNYEQSHMFGLRLLGFLQSDLDILLLIESQYQSTRLLLNLQKSNRANNKGLCIDYENKNNTDSNMPSLNLQDNSEQLDEDDTETETYDVDDSAEKKDIIIDLLSVERNFVLVNSNIIGGPGEKLLPERYINDIKKIYKYPLFDQLPVPSYYIKKADYSKMKSSSGIKELIETFEFDKLIKGSQESQREWTNSFKTCLLDAIRSFEFKSSDIGKALGQYFKVQAAKSETTLKLEAFGRFKNLGEFIAKYENTKSSITLSNIQKLGIEKTIQYGIQIGLLEKSNRDEYTNNLTELHKQLNVLLKRPNRKSDDVKVSSSTTSTSSTNPTLAYCDERNYPGYDWFASLLFLLNSGETNATVELLVNIASSCLSVELLWPAYQYARGDNSGVSPLLATTCHYVELILKTEQPLVFSAFRMSGLTPAQICLHWIKQCFLNHIDWPEIVAFLVAELVLGIDYQTYFCVVLLKHMNGRNQSIVQHHTNRDLQFFLRGNQIENFKVTDYLEYMHEMEGKYRHYIDEDVQRTFDKDKIEK